MAGGITETGEPYSAYVSAMLKVDVVSTSVSGWRSDLSKRVSSQGAFWQSVHITDITHVLICVDFYSEISHKVFGLFLDSSCNLLLSSEWNSGYLTSRK